MNDLAAHLRSLEESLFDPAIRSSREELGKRLAHDFREIGSSGRLWSLEETLASLPLEKPEGLSEGSDYHLDLLAESLALLTYRAVYRRSDGSERRTLRSSIWRLDDDGYWRMVFHQGTLAARM